MDKKDQTNIIFSYFPLMAGPYGQAFMGPEAIGAAEEIGSVLEQLPSGSALACLWFIEHDKANPVFVIENAKAIAEHLKWWSEGKPEDWFSLHIMEKGRGYAMALMPDFKKTSDRWKIAFQLRHGFPPPEGSENILFRPLHCTAPGRAAYDQTKAKIGDTMPLRVVDADDVTPENAASLDIDQTFLLGEFKVVRQGKGLQKMWLESVLDDCLKAAQG